MCVTQWLAPGPRASLSAGLTLAGLAAAGKHASARAGVVMYVGVLHLYMLALVFLARSGPHATNTETKTKEIG